MSYDRRTGILSFSASSENVTSFPGFVEALRATGLFADIQYRGYVKSSHTEIASQSTDEAGIVTTTYYTTVEYGYTVVCQLAKPQPHLPDVPETEDDDAGDVDKGAVDEDEIETGAADEDGGA
jgi:hypothetical protein